MGQQQFRISFSVGTKLLLSVVLLLVIVIAFLNVSAILLLKEDKRAYIYQTQSTAAILASKEFVSNARRALDKLRLALASVDPKKGTSPDTKFALQALLDNQSELLFLTVNLLDLSTGNTSLLTHASAGKLAQEAQVSLNDLTISQEWVKTFLPELQKNSFAFVNLSRLGGPPLLGVVVADLKLKNNPGGMPIAVGAVSIAELSHELAGMNFTVATRSGWVLFDTDSTVLFARKNISDDPLFEASANSRLASGAYEYENNGVDYLGSYVFPGLSLGVFMRSEWQKANKATYALTEKFLLLGLMAVGVAVVFAILFSKTLTAPINRLYKATKQVADGNFNLNLSIRGRDEIGALTDSFNVMSRQIAGLIEEKLESARLENEIAIASTVQQTLIPPPSFRNANIHIHSHYRAASECGGDWWGFFGVGKKMALMIADATGHGFPSALITASARSCFSVMHKLAQEDSSFSFSPSAMLSFANRTVFDASMSKIMMTFFIGVFDFELSTLTYSNAGHNPPWHFRARGEGHKLTSLVARGPRLGEYRDCPDFEEKSIQFQPDDILFFYTDGLIEGTDASGAAFGKRRVRQLVEASLSGGPENVVNELMRDFLAFNGEKALDDDITLAAARILGGAIT